MLDDGVQLERDPVVDAIDELSNYVITEDSLDRALQLVVDLAAASIAGTAAAGISLIRKGEVITAVSTGAKVDAVDKLQYDAGEGPCLQAIKDGQPQLVRSMLTDSRWPEFANRALYEGVQSILAVPLRSPDEVFGALNLYSQREDPWDERAIAVTQRFASRASVLLYNVTRYHDTALLAAQLQEALVSRAVIDQAKGILMERDKCTADQAFERLKTLSQRSNIKVRELAQRIVDDVAPIER